MEKKQQPTFSEGLNKYMTEAYDNNGNGHIQRLNNLSGFTSDVDSATSRTAVMSDRGLFDRKVNNSSFNTHNDDMGTMRSQAEEKRTDMLNSVAKKNNQVELTIVSDNIKHFLVHKLDNINLANVITNDPVEHNRIEKYHTIKQLLASVPELGTMVKIYHASIIDGDMVHPLALDLSTTHGTLTDIQTKVVSRVFEKYDINKIIKKVVEDAITYGDGFFLVSPIGSSVMNTVDSIITNISKNNNIDGADKINTVGDLLTIASGDRIENNMNPISEGDGNTQNNFDPNLNNIYEVSISEKIDSFISDYPGYNTSVANLYGTIIKESTTNNNPLLGNNKHQKTEKGSGSPIITTPDSRVILENTLREFNISYGGSSGDYSADNVDTLIESDDAILLNEEVLDLYNNDLNIDISEATDKNKNTNISMDIGDIFSRKKRKYTKRQKSNDSADTSITNVLSSVIGKGMDIKGAIFRRVPVDNIVKLTTNTGYCLGYLYNNMTSLDNHELEFDKGRGEVGGLDDVSNTGLGGIATKTSGSATISSSKNYSSPGVIGEIPSLLNLLKDGGADNDTKNKTKKTITKLLLHSIKAPIDINKLSDENMIDVMNIIDSNMNNKIYYFRPDEIHHLTIRDGDNGYGVGILDPIIPTARLKLILNQMWYVNESKKIPYSVYKVYVPRAADMVSILSQFEEFLRKTVVIDPSTVNSASQVLSMQTQSRDQLIPVVGDSEKDFYEQTQVTPVVAELSESLMEKVDNLLIRLSEIPINKFDDTIQAEFATVINKQQYDWVRRIHAYQNQLTAPISKAIKSVFKYDMLSYNQLVTETSAESDEDKVRIDTKLKLDIYKILSTLKPEVDENGDVIDNKHHSGIDPEVAAMIAKGISDKATEEAKDKKKQPIEKTKQNKKPTVVLTPKDRAVLVEALKFVDSLIVKMHAADSMHIAQIQAKYEELSNLADGLSNSLYPEILDDTVMIKIGNDKEVDSNKIKRAAFKKSFTKSKIASISPDIEAYIAEANSLHDEIIEELKAHNISAANKDSEGDSQALSSQEDY